MLNISGSSTALIPRSPPSPSTFSPSAEVNRVCKKCVLVSAVESNGALFHFETKQKLFIGKPSVRKHPETEQKK